jgi:hypothetical protein
MKTTNQIFLFLAIVFALFISACTTPSSLYREGKDDEAIRLAVDYFRSHRKIKDKDLMAFEKAFNTINNRDDARMRTLLSEGRNENYPEVYTLAQRMKTRQALVQPYLPVRLKETKREIALYIVEVDAILLDAKQKSAAFKYQQATDNMALARKGNRFAARNAYLQLEQLATYYTDYKDAIALREEAYNLGINRVLIRLQNEAFMPLPYGFERDIMPVVTRDLNTQWVKYYTSKNTNLQFDYTIVARVTSINISPSIVNHFNTLEEKSIQDGFQYVLDKRGNVQKDSLGNDMKVPKFRIVHAEVREMEQRKSAQLTMLVEYFDNANNNRIFTQPIVENSFFEYRSLTFSGDRRALKKETECRLGNSVPAPFPNDADMLLRTTNDVKNALRNAIAKNEDLVYK